MNCEIDLSDYFCPKKDIGKRIKIRTDKNEYLEIIIKDYVDFSSKPFHFIIKDIVCKCPKLNKKIKCEFYRSNKFLYNKITGTEKINRTMIYCCSGYCGYFIKIIDFWDLDELEKHQKYFRKKVWKELMEEYYSPYKKWNKNKEME